MNSNVRSCEQIIEKRGLRRDCRWEIAGGGGIVGGELRTGL